MNYYKVIETPIGELTLTATDTHLIAIDWGNTEAEKNPEEMKKSKSQLKEYFAGKRKAFDIPIQTQGTKFQEKVWRTLKRIPYGQTWTYKKLATAIGNPQACRAVGAANGQNPLSILIPCHRVIGSNGGLTGFGAGLETKAVLLNYEKRG